jgi:hypothetical protein
MKILRVWYFGKTSNVPVIHCLLSDTKQWQVMHCHEQQFSQNTLARVVFLLVSITLCLQGCQMVFFQIQYPDLVIFWWDVEWKILIYVKAIWYILWSFGIFYVYLVYFMSIWYILWLFGIYPPFWYITPRKILQPCQYVVKEWILNTLEHRLWHSMDFLPSKYVSNDQITPSYMYICITQEHKFRLWVKPL